MQGQTRESGLYRLAGFVFAVVLAIAGLAYAIGGGAEAAPAAVAVADREPDRGKDAPRRAAAVRGGDEVCAPEGAPVELGEELRESSGVAASRAHPGIFWTHNDSGEPLLYAVDAAGRTVGRVRVADAEVEDWEDVSRAPCPGGGDCLYVADVGDNDAARASVTVWRLPEPAPGAARSAPATALRLRYPDGAHDAEAIYVADGAVHVVTKGESGPIAVYRAPADGGEATLQRLRALSDDRVKKPERVTGADVSPDGRWVALRTLEEVALYPAAGLAGDGPLSPRRIGLGALDEAQGEGVAFTPDGALVLTSEAGRKKGRATLARMACTLR
ncbi:MAG TPA: hypothetical protein VHG91_01820 [Longimicrobium sp.]|nr:hypothetical protein [Longimicrobium sp.]